VRKQHEQDRNEHPRTSCGRLDEDAANRGEREARVDEPPRLPRDGERAVGEDNFLSLAHQRSQGSALCGRASFALRLR
jgi:hypothetical protein